jgi:hypothetical protein
MELVCSGKSNQFLRKKRKRDLSDVENKGVRRSKRLRGMSPDIVERSTQSTVREEEMQMNIPVHNWTHSSRGPPAIWLTTPGESSEASRASNLGHAPRPHLLEGRPFLGIVYHGFCLDGSSRKAKWQSECFFARIRDEMHRTDCRTHLAREGYILIPKDLFTSYHPSQIDFLSDLFDHFSVPNHPLPSVLHFVCPSTGLFQSHRLGWWKRLAQHFRVPHYLEIVYDLISDGTWHMVFHSARTFQSIQELFEITESLSLWRATERIHLELARRITFMECC